jgi:hypothetical protein
VSISGFTAVTYTKNHIGGNFELVCRNLEYLKCNRYNIKDLVIKYLVFKYNKKEINAAKDFCKNNGFNFSAYSGAIPCPQSFLRYFGDYNYKNSIVEFIDHERINFKPIKSCPQERTIVLNYKAELVQCCMSRYRGIGISIFEADIENYLNHRIENEFCVRCLTSGFCYYTHFERNVYEL